jgi:hypothetical protein
MPFRFRAPFAVAALALVLFAGLAIAAIVVSQADDDDGGGAGEGTFSGQFTQSFEVSSFQTCPPSDWEEAWLQANDDQFFARFNALAEEAGVDGVRQPFTVRVEFEGLLEIAAEGEGFGHLAAYAAQVTVERLIAMEPGECAE